MGDFIPKDLNSNSFPYYVKPLHEAVHLIDDVCNLINLEWKRSHTARLRSIEGSSDNFPMSLLLLKSSKKPEVVGHCKISRLSMSNTKVFVETVVIHPLLRGKGLGRFLMLEVEKECKSKNIEWIYLATKGQEGFYEKLGYEKCPPVSIYGCQFDDSNDNTNEVLQPKKTVLNTVSNNLINGPPPPPPPPPKISQSIYRENNEPRMRDYTTNNFCDYLWIGDLLDLKQNDKREFCLEINNNNNKKKPLKVKIGNVIIFGTIVEVKQVGSTGYLYHVDDGTGVIPCKHSEDQFQEIIRSIEDEQIDVSNQTFEYSQTDISTNDTIFNDRSMQLEEINFNKKSRLMGLQSIWNDVYDSFHSLIEPYTVGDTVIVQGKLYSYINMNQIYINSIRPMGITEEIVQISVKLKDGLDKSNEREASLKQTNPVNRMSGLMTFDNITHLDPKITNPRSIRPTELRTEVVENIPDVVTPNLETALTFDTFAIE